MGSPKQIFIVEDHQAFAEALALSFHSDPRFEVCGVAGDLVQATAMMAEVRPDLVIVDHQLPGGTGLELIPLLREMNPDSRYLMLSQEEPATHAPRARQAGASGYLQKGVPLLVLLDVAASILAGAEHFPGICAA
jgi:DNA-binding NarL/FixJ family response regulator